MTLDDLPELREHVQRFAEAARELDEAVKRYRAYGTCPLDEAAVQNIELARYTGENVLRG